MNPQRGNLAEVSGCTRVGTLEKTDLAGEKAWFILQRFGSSKQMISLKKRITTSRTKFTHCVASLPQDVACRLLDLVRAPPVEPDEALRRRHNSDVFPECFPEVPDFAEFVFIVPPTQMDNMLILLPKEEKPGARGGRAAGHPPLVGPLLVTKQKV